MIAAKPIITGATTTALMTPYMRPLKSELRSVACALAPVSSDASRSLLEGDGDICREELCRLCIRRLAVTSREAIESPSVMSSPSPNADDQPPPIMRLNDSSSGLPPSMFCGLSAPMLFRCSAQAFLAPHYGGYGVFKALSSCRL
eukprot:4533866-Prymnesium_polylepis.1